MKSIISALILMFSLTLTGQSYAANSPFSFDSIKSVQADKMCDEDKKDKKKEGDEEPECD